MVDFYGVKTLFLGPKLRFSGQITEFLADIEVISGLNPAEMLNKLLTKREKGGI